MRLQSLLLMAGLFSAAAQTGQLRFPALGFGYDSRSNQLRPFRGIPGAAVMGDALESASPFASAAISPLQDTALAISANDGQLYLVPLTGAPAQSVAGAMPAPAHIAFSPSGTAAVLWGSRLQILTGLAGTPQVADVPVPPFAATAIALSDDARELLAVSGRDADPLWLLDRDGGATQLPLAGPIAAVAFRRSSRDAVAVTRSGDVYSIRNAGAGAEVRLVYPGDTQTADPVAVQISPDGARAFTANARGTLATIGLGNGSVASLACGCSPTGLDPLNSPSLFRLTEISDHPVMLFDASTPTPAIWFVPADAPLVSLQRSAQ